MPTKDQITVAEAARIKGVTPSTVRHWIQTGLIKAELLTNRLALVSRKEIENLEIPKRGRKPRSN